jgi:hypothetical protein
MAEDSGRKTTAGSGRVMVTTRPAADPLASSLMLVFVTSAVAISLMPVVTNELRDSVGLTDAQIGLLTSVFMGFYGVAGISSGIAAARWGGRLLGVSCGCFVVGSLIFALSSGMRVRRSLTPEFKAEVVALARRGDRSIADLCLDLDLVESVRVLEEEREISKKAARFFAAETR